MKLNYNKSGDALYIRFDKKPYAESDEVEPGVILDYDKKGKIIGIEILGVSKKFSRSFKASLLRKRIPVALGK